MAVGTRRPSDSGCVSEEWLLQLVSDVDLENHLRLRCQKSPIKNGTKTNMCQGLNSHYVHIIGDGHQPNSRGLYTVPIARIPIKGGMTIPNIATFDHGTYDVKSTESSKHGK